MDCHAQEEPANSNEADQQQALENVLIKEFGVILGGRALLKTLGIGSYTTLQRQVDRGALGFRLFSIPGRRGRFALAGDVASWLTTLRSKASDHHQSGADSKGGS